MLTIEHLENDRMPLTDSEKRLASTVGFEEDVCEFVKQIAGREFNRLVGINKDFEKQDADGLSIAVERQEVEPILSELQPGLTERAYRAFWSELHDANGAQRSDEIAILKTTDPYAIIDLRQSNGANYGVTNDDVVSTLKSWESRYQFEIVGAGESWVALCFESPPNDICSFAEEIYEFCPDTVEQGAGLLNESDDPAAFEAARTLCPQLSEKSQQKLADQQAQFQKLDIPPELRALLESGAGGFTTPTDMGIRLLAYQLQQSKQLFLWWD